MKDITQKNNRLSLEKVLILCVFISCIVLIQDIAAKYFLDEFEQISIITLSLKVVIDVLFLYYFKISFKTLFDLKKTDCLLLIVCFFLGLVIMFFGSCIQSIIMLFISGNETPDERSALFLIFLALYSALIAPIFEEIEYRVLLFLSFLKKSNKLILAIVASSIMFLVIHSGSINCGALILGIISAIIYYKTRNIIYSIMMHFAGNLVGAVLILSSLQLNNTEISEEILIHNDIVFSIVANSVLGIFWMIVLVCFLVFIFYRIKNKLPNQKIEFNYSMRQNDEKWFVSIILIIIYIVICFFDWMFFS